MAFMNPTLNLQVVARLGRDAEIRHTKSGRAVANVSGAHNYKYTHNGEKKEITTWVQLSFWGEAQAELAQRLLKKGCLVLFNGRPGVSSWDNNGEVKTSLTLDVANFKIMSYPEGYQMGEAHNFEAEEIPF